MPLPPSPDNPPRHPFTQHLQIALTTLLKETVVATIPDKKARVFCFEPRPQLRPDSGCWCPDLETPYVHSWRNCPNVSEYVDAAGRRAVLSRCPHGLVVPSEYLQEHWFCFQVPQVGATYMSWFMEHHLALSARETASNEVESVRRMLQQYHSRRKPADKRSGAASQSQATTATLIPETLPGPTTANTPAPAPASPKQPLLSPTSEIADQESQTTLLYTFIQTMRRPPLPHTLRPPSSIDEQRVRHLLAWEDRSFQCCLSDISRIMNSPSMDVCRSHPPGPPELAVMAAATAVAVVAVNEEGGE